MAIIRFTHNFRDIPADAVEVKHTLEGHTSHACRFDKDEVQGHYGEYKIGPQILTTWYTHVGLCLRDYERNGYDDSDFYMEVWNDEKAEVETICFASTRGWSYPAYNSFADASEMTKRKYAAYRDNEERERILRNRRSDAKILRQLRAEVRAIAAANKVNPVRFMQLRKPYGKDAFKALLSLFGSRIRNNFKLKLRAQVIAWLQDDAPKYATPLSKKQMQYV